jgi:hypothetical protein
MAVATVSAISWTTLAGRSLAVVVVVVDGASDMTGLSVRDGAVGAVRRRPGR